MSKTIGEQRVRIDFNPSNDDSVHLIKTKVAELINLAEQMKSEGKDVRLCSVAQTELENAGMWLVKAATS
ncbi:hypothetical protein [Myroides sp. LoEW2-1]|uniref:Acb2/Tad1 domain-containing protein n=1 Tax=Myroides sp. LoEW2-1 TaxID=2683192 RepID=UPI0013252477|nr:hypothetical protein [Myroides sp. LoEW2-1]MVX36233.1 hypothetical protein [Myroides sp. LoEW2-1]